MKFKFLFTVLVLACSFAAATAPLRGEDPKAAPVAPPPHGDIQTAVFAFQHSDGKSLHDQIISLPGYFGGGTINFDWQSRSIFVIGSKELVAACAEAIKRLDVPPKAAKNIDLTFYILVASKKALPDGDCPAVIQAFCEQMKGVFKGFRLLETVTVRTREGSAEESKGVIAPGEPGGDTMAYRLRFDSARISTEDKDARPIIRINKLDFTATVRLPKEAKTGSADSGGSYRDVGVSASVDFREGQEVGITTLSKGTPGESLCIVARAKIVE